jgi:hypothetical protein
VVYALPSTTQIFFLFILYLEKNFQDNRCRDILKENLQKKFKKKTYIFFFKKSRCQSGLRTPIYQGEGSSWSRGIEKEKKFQNNIYLNSCMYALEFRNTPPPNLFIIISFSLENL